MKRSVIGIEREETTLITKETIYKALEQAYSELRSGECGIVDIVLPLDEPHNYTVYYYILLYRNFQPLL